jgi:type IV pilus assembly protein PilA
VLNLLKKEKGFTLIELMVVILIIAILVAIAVPVFNIARTAAYRRTCQANLRTLDGAVQTYNATEDAWPSGVTALVNGEYVKEEPQCPVNDASYTYSTTDHDFACPNNGSTVNGINCSGHSYP